MKFEDLKINQRFKFIDDPKIYTKEDNYSAVRNMTESFIFADSNVELVNENEEENYEEIEKRSYWNRLVHEEGIKRNE